MYNLTLVNLQLPPHYHGTKGPGQDQNLNTGELSGVKGLLSRKNRS